MIDVTGVATASTASRVLLSDWFLWAFSERDWSVLRKFSLHSRPVDSILLQFRRSRGKMVVY